MRGYRSTLLVLSAVGVTALAACATHAPKVVTAAPTHPPCQTAELVFGRVSDDGKGGVSEADFAHFVDGEVSPRFPQGMTVIDAEGRWTPPAGSMIRTPAKMVMIVLPGAPDDQKKLEAVRLAYKERFHQPSALLVINGDCVSF